MSGLKKGNHSGQGGASVPLYDGSELRQPPTSGADAEDFVVITGSTAAEGDLLVVRAWAPQGSTLAIPLEVFAAGSSDARILKMRVEDVSSGSTAVSVGASQSGSILLIGGASAAVTLSLPAIQTGLNYLLYNSDAQVSSATHVQGQATGLMCVAGDTGGADSVLWGSTVSNGAAMFVFGSTATGKWHCLALYNGSSLMGTTGAGVFLNASS